MTESIIDITPRLPKQEEMTVEQALALAAQIQQELAN